MYTHVCMCMYIYIYNMYMYTCMYVYIYKYIGDYLLLGLPHRGVHSELAKKPTARTGPRLSCHMRLPSMSESGGACSSGGAGFSGAPGAAGAIGVAAIAPEPATDGQTRHGLGAAATWMMIPMGMMCCFFFFFASIGLYLDN